MGRLQARPAFLSLLTWNLGCSAVKEIGSRGAGTNGTVDDSLQHGPSEEHPSSCLFFTYCCVCSVRACCSSSRIAEASTLEL